MAVLAFTSCSITINSVDHSADISAVEIDLQGVELDTTNFGSAGWNEAIQGLKSGTLKMTFQQDFAGTTVDDRIWALFDAGAAIAAAIRPTSASIGATNPEYQFNVLPTEHMPIVGSVGDLGIVDLTWPITGAVTRATA